MKITTNILLIIFLFAIMLSPIKAQEGDVPSTSREYGKVNSPKYKFIDVNNKTYTSKDYAGKIVIVDCWTTWCKPCQKGIPELMKIQEKYDGKVILFGISFDKTFVEVDKYLVEDLVGKKINYPVMYGEDYSFYFGDVTIVPTKFILDKEGFLRYEIKGYTPQATIEAYIERLLSEK